MSDQHSSDEMQTLIDPVYRLASQIVSVLTAIVWLTLFAVIILIAAYLFALFGMDMNSASRANALIEIRQVISSIWDKLLPIAQQVLRFIAPVMVILLAVLGLRTLSRSGAAPFDLSRITSDLPSALALIIIVTICLLPLAGVAIPDVLNNVALVVVGFYFGRRETDAQRKT